MHGVDGVRLKAVPLFALLSDRRRNQLAGVCHELAIDRGEHLVDEGQFAYEFYVIEEGTAAVVGSGKHLTDLRPGDFFGEIALLRGGERTASVIATSPVKAFAMYRADFEEMTRSLPNVATQIEATIEERLARDRMFGREPV